MDEAPLDARARLGVPGPVAITAFVAIAGLVTATAAVAQSSIDRTRDRGTGVPSSMFGTYVQEGEFLVYPYYEHYRDSDAEYKPSELGFEVNRDFRGRYVAHEGLVFLGYGISENVLLELEAAVISASQERSPDDPSAMPQKLEESGLGDVESQLRWRWTRETDSRPEFFSYFETVFPFQRTRRLIGTQDWEFQLGTGLVRGFAWGTVTLRVAAGYDKAEDAAEIGEYAVEYLRRISSRLRIFASAEGSEDEIELITEAQVFVTPDLFLKLNNAVGLTSKATGWAPEVGIMFSFK